MSEREITFSKCSSKNIAMEKILTNSEPILIIAMENNNNKRLTDFTGKRFSYIDKMNNNEMRVLNIQERGSNAHSNILIKNIYLKNGWSIFEPNGQLCMHYSITNADGDDVTLSYIDVSPTATINYGATLYNPGYCGILGIIFMVYFKNNNTKPTWVNSWKYILKILQKQHIQTNRGSHGVDLAAHIQSIISSNKEGSLEVEGKILASISEFIK